VAETPEFVNVTCTDDAVPGRALEGVLDPITTTTSVPLEHEHDAAAVLFVGTLLPTRAVHAKPEMKLVPVTVMVLLTYAEVGAMETAVGFALTFRDVPATVAILLPFVNVTSTDDAPTGVVAPITTVTELALTYVHAAAVPKLGVAPTFAVHALLMKFPPITVMVLPTYAEAGAMEVAAGSSLTVSVVPETVATLLPFVNVTCTDDAAASVAAPITTVTEVALMYVHVASVPELGVAPTFAVHKLLMKFEPVTVIVLPTAAVEGVIEVAVGSALTFRDVPVTVATLAPFVNVTSTDDAATGVPAPITTTTVIAFA
jgi:hypothetical protein